MIPTAISTERLQIKTVAQQDAPALFNIWADSKVTRFMNIDAFTEITQAEAMIAFFEKSFKEATAVRYSIFFEKTCIGSCGFNQFDWTNRTTEIGYELAENMWGKGLGSEIVACLCDTAFHALNLNKVQAFVEPENSPSEKLLMKYGFKKIGQQADGLNLFEKEK